MDEAVDSLQASGAAAVKWTFGVNLPDEVTVGKFELAPECLLSPAEGRATNA
jgi:hypothetical protein